MEFVSIDRDTPMLLPMDLRQWIEDDHIVHFILEAVERVDMCRFKVKKNASGKAQYPPRMMLALMIYSYTLGLFSSRRIEASTHRDIYVRYLAGNTHPDHDTICSFRRENFEAISECFLQILLLARELKLMKVGTVAVDGSHFKANASKDKNVIYERAKQLEAQLTEDIADLMRKAEVADNEPMVDEKLPRELQRRENLKARMQSAQEQLIARAKAQAESQRPAYEAKAKAYAERKGKGRGRPPKPPEDDPPSGQQCNLTDPDSRVMRKHKQGTTQSYNAQLCVDADGSQLILSNHITQSSPDSRELEPALRNIRRELGRPAVVLADSGYCSSEVIERLEKANCEPYVCTGNEAFQNGRVYDYRPQSEEKTPRKVVNPTLVRMTEKLQTPEGRKVYSRRQSSVEPVFGIIKQAMGFRQFLLRGFEKVRGEWNLVCLAYNVKRLFNLSMAAQAN